MDKREMVERHVYGKICMFQSNEQWSRATFAKLRRGIGKDISESPETWEAILGGMPVELISKSFDGVEATPSENAIYTALTLFALHQQSCVKSVNKNGISFGSAVSMLRSGNEEGIKRRFDSVVTASDLNELSFHARGLIQLMKSSNFDIGFDYPKFAGDLYRFQFPDGRRRVILNWGQDFYRMNKDEENKTDG